MLACLNELALNYTVRDAVDGRYNIRLHCSFFYVFDRNLNESYLQELGIHFMPGWRDPWGERYKSYSLSVLTAEFKICCFFQPSNIW